jgi:hypothetical protein
MHKEFIMFWTWLFLRRGELSEQTRTGFHLHVNSAFRMLLIGGNILVLAILWYIQQNIPHHQVYDLWLAGFAATIGMLLICTIGSAHINGYRYCLDFWMKLATAFMFVLCFVAVINVF